MAEEAARKYGLRAGKLSAGGRRSKVSAARRELIRVAVVGRDLRPVDGSSRLRISTANLAEHLAAIHRDEGV